MSHKSFVRCASRLLALPGVALLAAGMLAAQTNSTGAVSGTVKDPTGRVIASAVVTLTEPGTSLHQTTITDSSGNYVFTSLSPGSYAVSAVAPGFSTSKQSAVVRVNLITSANFALKLGAATQTVEVSGTAGTVQVDTTTAAVGGVITAEQIKNLPQIGRNFLDLAQLQPGVQMIDGGNFDPTKNGFAGLSVQGAEGRTTEINVNGADISDQTVGTTTINLAPSSIHGFQVSQSSGDTSSDIGNAGQVNITTQRGSNNWHGDAFANYRSARFSANPTLATVKPPFKQNQDGLSLGGPLWKNRVYFFVNGERYDRDAYSAVQMPDFAQYNGFFLTPGFEKDADARVDWQISKNLSAFYYFAHGSNRIVPPSVIGGNSLQPFTNEDVSNLHDVSLTWNQGRFTHVFHYDHLGFFNHIYSAPVPGAPNIPIDISFSDTGESFGPNLLAPQHTFQIDNEFKYDGNFYFGNHTVRYGIEYNKIANLVYAAFFAEAPQVTPAVSNGPVNGEPANNPESYSPQVVTFGNGQGYFSNLPMHGNPYGGVYNNRLAWYLADTWRALPNLTVNYGVHFERDPGEVNTDLTHPAVLGAAFPQLAHAASIPNNFSPTLGIAWDPTGKGTWVIRAGAGMYYQNDIWNNVMFERSNYISSAIAPAFPFTAGSPFTTPQGTCVFLCKGQPSTGTSLTSQSIADLQSAMLKAQAEYQAAVAQSVSNISSATPTILGTPGVSAPGTNIGGNPLFDDTYRTPYSVQYNFGIQHQLRQGVVLSANYVSNRGFDLLMIQDLNDVGDARFFSPAAAADAINGAASDLGVAQGSSTQATVQNMINAIGSNYTPTGGAPTKITSGIIASELMGNSSGVSLGAGPNSDINAPNYAFGGKNPNFGNLATDRNLGVSSYNALQVKLRLQNLGVMQQLHANSLTVSYALGRLNATQSDQSFAAGVFDNTNPRRFYGPTGYDRTSQLSIGGVFGLPWGLTVGTVNHFETGFPVTPRLSSSGLGSGEVFRTDWLGTGTTQDIVPGANLGSFNRSIGSPAELQNLIDSYNSSFAGTLTPAGQAVVTSGVMTAAQMSTLGLTMPYINAEVAPGQLMPDSFMDSDLTIKKNFTIGDKYTISPEIDCFNVFNVGNYDPPGNVMSGFLPTGLTPPAPGVYGNPNSIANATYLNRSNKFGLNTGVFAPGIPRAFQGRISFTF